MKLENLTLPCKMTLSEIRAIVLDIAEKQINAFDEMSKTPINPAFFEDYRKGCVLLIREFKHRKYPRDGYRDARSYIDWTVGELYDIVHTPEIFDNPAFSLSSFADASSGADILYMLITAYLEDLEVD